jgi:anti-sigma28 factor (negative regulator of flagellin synthesis)
MKVNDPNLTNNLALGVGRTQGTEAADQANRTKATRHGGEHGSDRVDMSGTVAMLQQDAALHVSRVDRLSEAVQAGRYRVDAKAVSHKIVEASLSGTSGAAGGHVSGHSGGVSRKG